MMYIRFILVAFFCIAIMHLRVFPQNNLISTGVDSLGWEHWEVQRIDQDTSYISLEICEQMLGLEPVMVVFGERLFACKISRINVAIDDWGPWRFRLAAYEIHHDSLVMIEWADREIPEFKAEGFRHSFEVDSEETSLHLIYQPESKYGGSMIYDCAYYEIGDGVRLYKQLVKMVKKISKRNPPTRFINYLDEI